MKIQKQIIAIFSIIILTSASLIYFINKNHKSSVENSIDIKLNRTISKNIDKVFYSLTMLELHSQKYVITSDINYKKAAAQELSNLRSIATELSKAQKKDPKAYEFVPLLEKNLL
jgi:hypothetical protein